MERELQQRSGGICELCGSNESLSVYIVTPKPGNSVDEAAYICSTCKNQLDGTEDKDPNHWRCLNDSMWSEVPAVKVIAWRVLTELKGEGWPNDLLDMMYLDDEILEWAKSEATTSEDTLKHIDSNGSVLSAGDTVVLIKDLDVKGANFVAKRGTAVRNITLVHDNNEHIEGRVNGQKIVILTKFVKK